MHINRRGKISAKVAAAVAIVSAGVPIVSHEAEAQSPNPYWYLADINTTQGFPMGANAVVVEALGMIANCNFSPYTPNEVISKVAGFIKLNGSESQAILEISPQTICDTSVTDYINAIEGAVTEIYYAVGQSEFSRYFGGVMLDEEPAYGFSPSQLDYINQQVSANIEGSKLFTEVGYCASCWSQSSYESITTGNNGVGSPSNLFYVPSPQIYNSAMATEQNNSTNDGSSMSTLVTCPVSPSTGIFNCPTAVADTIGVPWTDGNWGGGYWVNHWSPV